MIFKHCDNAATTSGAPNRRPKKMGGTNGKYFGYGIESDVSDEVYVVIFVLGLEEQVQR